MASERYQGRNGAGDNRYQNQVEPGQVRPRCRPLPGRRCKRLSPADVEGLQLSTESAGVPSTVRRRAVPVDSSGMT